MLTFLYSLKILYFVSLLIITNIKLYSTSNTSSLDLSSLTIKSIATNSHGFNSTYSDYSSLYNKCLVALFKLYY